MKNDLSILQQYDENEYVKDELHQLLASDCSGRKRGIGLNHLLSTLETPLAKGHVQYYINQYRYIKRARIITTCRILCIIFFLILCPVLGLAGYL